MSNERAKDVGKTNVYSYTLWNGGSLKINGQIRISNPQRKNKTQVLTDIEWEVKSGGDEINIYENSVKSTNSVLWKHT